MSLLKALDNLRTFERLLVYGYFRRNHESYTPQSIVQLCILYCFILDEFDANHCSTNIEIKGLNNTICSFGDVNAVESESNTIGFQYCNVRNIASKHGKYHWQIKVSNSLKYESTASQTVDIGFTKNESDISIDYGLSICLQKGKRATDLINIYLDLDENIIFYARNRKHLYTYSEITKSNSYRLMIHFNCTNYAEIELVSYHNSRFYKNAIINEHDGAAHAKYAECIHNVDQKMKHYSIALQKYPNVSRWNNEYLCCLFENEQYDKAYQYAMKYRKGVDGIYNLAKYYRDENECDKAVALYRLLSDDDIDVKDCNFEYALSLNKCGYSKEAIKYYQLHLNKCAETPESKQSQDPCYHNLGNIYYKLNDFLNASKWYNQLSREYIKEWDLEAKVGRCYEYCNTNSLHWSYNTNLLHARMLRDVDRNYIGAKQYYLKALELTSNDDERRNTLNSLGLISYLMGQFDDAIEWSLKGYKYDPNGYMFNGNLGVYYLKLNKLDESYNYLKKAVTINPNVSLFNAYYAILLYKLNIFDESVEYFEKMLSSKDKILGHWNNGIVLKCLFIYGHILYDRNEYKKSIEKCQEAINRNEFEEEYENKDEIYCLMSKSYTKLGAFENGLKYSTMAKQINPDK